MPRVTFAFSPDELRGASQRGETQPLATEFSVNPFENLDDKHRFSEMGGTCGAVALRSGVVRLVTMKLIGSGLLAFVCAQRATNARVAYSCALAAAVNAVATAHYLIICMSAQHFTPPFSHSTLTLIMCM